jgi:hypothetical protein
MKITGECHCGAIGYEAEIDPSKVGICHCCDCQSLSASAFRTVAIANADSFRLTKDAPSEYVKTAESGNKRIQAFCPECGSAIYSTNADGAPKAFNIRLGTSHQRESLSPKFQCWTRSALQWVPEISGTRKYYENPQ